MSYCYSRLPNAREDIRILALRPDRNDELLAIYNFDCSLHRQFGLPVARYEALSYTWGEDTIETRYRQPYLTINGGKFRIKANLSAALSRLRPRKCAQECPRLCPRCTRFLWVDAICINQGDNLERTEQVAIMSRIYARAMRTVIWLGEDSAGNGEMAFDFFGWIAKIPSDQPGGTRVIDKGHSEVPGADQLRQVRPVDPKRVTSNKFTNALKSTSEGATQKLEGLQGLDVKEAIKAYVYAESRGKPYGFNRFSMNILMLFLNRPWFSRRWIIQEVYVAKEAIMMCGSHQMLWSEFCNVVSSMKWPEKMQQHCLALRLVEDPGNDARKSILSALDRFQAFECKEGHDRIAALTGLWSGHRSWTSFKVDYSRDTEDNYFRFAEFMVHAGHVLQTVLCAAQRKRRQGHSELPSWVPDWRILSDQGEPIKSTFDKANNAVVNDHGLLSTKCHWPGEVTEISPEKKLPTAWVDFKTSTGCSGRAPYRQSIKDRPEMISIGDMACALNFPEGPYVILRNPMFARTCYDARNTLVSDFSRFSLGRDTVLALDAGDVVIV